MLENRVLAPSASIACLRANAASAALARNARAALARDASRDEMLRDDE